MDNNAYLRIGERAAGLIGFNLQLAEVAQIMGFKSKQLAHYHANVALGKLIYRLRQVLAHGHHEELP